MFSAGHAYSPLPKGGDNHHVEKSSQDRLHRPKGAIRRHRLPCAGRSHRREDQGAVQGRYPCFFHLVHPQQ